MSARNMPLGDIVRVNYGPGHSPLQQHPWMTDGVCAQFPQPDLLWFSDDKRAVTRAQELCQDCPIRQRCLDFALDYERDHGRSWGVWGGLTANQRSVILKGQQPKKPGPAKTATCKWCGAEFTWNGGGRRVNCDLHTGVRTKGAAA